MFKKFILVVLLLAIVALIAAPALAFVAVIGGAESKVASGSGAAFYGASGSCAFNASSASAFAMKLGPVAVGCADTSSVGGTKTFAFGPAMAGAIQCGGAKAFFVAF
jgi:hypothetical protein